MSDDEENSIHHLTRNEDGDLYSEKRSKRKKKKQASTSAPATATAALPKASLFARFADSRFSSTSPKSLLLRVLVLALFSVILISSFFYYEQMAEEEERMLLAREKARLALLDKEEEVTQKPIKAVVKFPLAKEREFGCKEVSCIVECNGKAKPKCLKSKSCTAERYHICHKRCRKARCEERCKNEPKMGYVEKEQGLENCKEACTGPTASHNKCIVQCHIKFKPCKNKCFENANKFKCDNPKILALLETANKPPEEAGGGGGGGASSAGGGGEDADDDEDFGAGSSRGGGGGGGGDDEDEDEDAPPPPSKSKYGKSAAALPGLDDDDLL